MRLSPALFEPVADRLRVLADPTRLRILNALREGESSVVQIVEKVGASQPNVSRHLALLLRAGILTRRQQGRQVHYRVVDPFLDQICEAVCGSLRAHVTRQAQRLPGLPTNGGRPRRSPAETTVPSPSARNRRRRT